MSQKLLLLQKNTRMRRNSGQKTAECLIRVYEGKTKEVGKIVIVATDVSCESVDKVEEIASAICRRQKAKPEEIIFIEHRTENSKFEETFDLVHLDWQAKEQKFTNPQWTAITKQEAENITGESL